MDASNFLNASKEVGDDIRKQKAEEFKDLLNDYANKVNSLDYGENVDFSNDVKFNELCWLLGEYPPIKLIEDVLSYYKKKRHILTTVDIPNIMSQMGIKKATTLDELQVVVQPEVSCEVKDKEKLMSWAIDNLYGDYIKDTLKFGKGELDQEVEEFLQAKGKSYEKDSGIHPMSLKKIISDRIKDEEKLPDESIIDIKVFNRAKIK